MSCRDHHKRVRFGVGGQASSSPFDKPSPSSIAATAAVHKLTVVTRNVADFEPFGVRVLNPFKTAKP